MKRSLSLILPVRNAEQSLVRDVERLLDVMPDLARRFEIVIVDQGSTDQTVDTAEQLAVEYPQIRVATAMPGQALNHGVQVSRGEAVVIHDGRTPLSADRLEALCREQPTAAAVALRAPRGAWGEPIKRRVESASFSKPQATSGFQILASEQIDKLRRSVAVMRDFAADKLSFQTDVAAVPPPSQTKRPNYLTQIKERLNHLTWGE